MASLASECHCVDCCVWNKFPIGISPPHLLRQGHVWLKNPSNQFKKNLYILLLPSTLKIYYCCSFFVAAAACDFWLNNSEALERSDRLELAIAAASLGVWCLAFKSPYQCVLYIARPMKLLHQHVLHMAIIVGDNRLFWLIVPKCRSELLVMCNQAKRQHTCKRFMYQSLIYAVYIYFLLWFTCICRIHERMSAQKAKIRLTHSCLDCSRVCGVN